MKTGIEQLNNEIILSCLPFARKVWRLVFAIVECILDFNPALPTRATNGGGVTAMTMIQGPATQLGGAENTYYDPLNPSVLPERPTFNQVVTAIQVECIAAGVACTERQARQIIGFFQHVFAKWQKKNRGGSAQRYFEWLSDRELLRFHDQLDVIMPDDTYATAGSAHDLLERHVFGDQYPRLQLIHTKVDDLKVLCSAGVDVVSTI